MHPPDNAGTFLSVLIVLMREIGRSRPNRHRRSGFARLIFYAQKKRSFLRSRRSFSCAFGAALVTLSGVDDVKLHSGAKTHWLRPSR
jgi:hypothetical protein